MIRLNNKLEIMNNKQFSDELTKYIPGGAHTYSRGNDQYPTNAPAILAGEIKTEPL